MMLTPIEVAHDLAASGLLIVCRDRAGCRNLDMPIWRPNVQRQIEAEIAADASRARHMRGGDAAGS